MRFAIGLLVVFLLSLGCGPHRGEETTQNGDTVQPGEPAPASDSGPPPQPGPDPTPQPVGPAPPQCQPTAGGPYWLTEGENLTVEVACATGGAGALARFTLSPLPAGATFDGTSLVWAPGLDQAGVYELTISDRASGEEGQLKIGVADNFLHPQNAPVDPFTYTEEYGLPVLHLRHPGVLVKKIYQPVEVIYRGRLYQAQGKLRGRTSLRFPKKSYTLQFAEAEPFAEPTVPSGFAGRRKLAVVTSFSDNAYIRPRLGFELWRRMDERHIDIKAFSAVLFLNGEFRGVYTVIDFVDPPLMEAHGLSKDDNLYKADHLSANFSRYDKFGKTKDELHLGFSKKNGVPPEGSPGAFEDLEELIAFVADADASAFRAGLPARIDLGDYQDWWIFVTLIEGSNNKSRNAYHFHPPGGVWRYAPWDLDATFGQTWQTRRVPPDRLDDFRDDNLLFRRLLEEPAFSGPMLARYRALLDDKLELTAVLALLDRLVAEVSHSARRDEARWGAEYRAFSLWADRTDLTTFEGEVRYVRAWVETRWKFLAGQLRALGAPP